MGATSPPLVKLDPRGDLTLRVGDTDHAENDSKPPRCFLVCSRTLSRVSPVFDRMINGSFAEANPKDTETDWAVDLPNDNPPAMELFLHISHGHLQRVPPALSTHEIYDLTVLTHFYDATQVLRPWIQPWIGALKETLGPGDEDAVAVAKMLWISWELGHRATFEATVRRITLEGPGSIFAEGSVLRELPMPSNIIERICEVRAETTNAMLDVMRSFTELLTVVDERPRWCRHATFLGPHRCESMILGSMTFCLTRASLWPMPKDAGYVEHSILGLYEAFSNLVIHDIGQPVKGEGDHTVCNPREYLMEELKEVLASMRSPLREADREQLEAQARKLHMQ